MWNNYPSHWTSLYEALAEEPRIEWLATTEEVGEKGTPHLQGNVYFKNRVTLGTIKTLFTAVHSDLNAIHIGDSRGCPCRGDLSANLSYITKTGVKLYEWGTRPSLFADGGEADRWKSVRLLAKSGQFASIEENYFDIWLRYDRKLRAMYIPDHLPSPCEVIWLQGPTRVGKDYWIDKKYPRLYTQMGMKWFDDYDGEEVVYIAEMDVDKARAMGIQLLKMLCDWTRVRVEVKGGSILIRPKTVLFSSNYTFKEVFSVFRKEDTDAMKARVTRLLYKSAKESEPEEVGFDFVF